MNGITCPECNGQGETAVQLAFGVYLSNEGELEMGPCRICKGAKVVVHVETLCADCDVSIIVTIPPHERIGERVCQDCASN